MDLIKITDLTIQLGISSRSLRYYEQTGLIRSIRSDSEKYRYYDAANIERLKQIMVLRKMQIPIKDIIRIYESEDMSVVVETFVNRIRSIDEEIDALSELRCVVNEFLQVMLQNGVTKISALPILYDKMEKQLELLERSKTMSYEKLSSLSEKLIKPVEATIVDLPSMRVLSSYLKENPHMSDPDGFWRFVQTQGISSGELGRHEQFEFQTSVGDVMILKVADDFVNCKYLGFLEKAQELNPDFTFLEEVRRQYRITGLLWNAEHEAGDGFAAEYKKLTGGVLDNLESIGGGFNITLEALQNLEKRSKIVATIRKFADCMDEVVRILRENL